MIVENFSPSGERSGTNWEQKDGKINRGKVKGKMRVGKSRDGKKEKGEAHKLSVDTIRKGGERGGGNWLF